MFKKFKNFLEEKSLVGDAKVKKIADYEGEQPSSPPVEKGKSAPYKPAKEFKNPNKEEKGLANSGDDNLIYKPKVDFDKKELGHYPKSENRLSPAKFVEKMSKIASLKSESANLPKLSSNNPHPSEVINFLTECAKSNSKVVENLVHDAKRSGLLYSILECAVSIPETYEILLNILKENTKATNKFAKLMEEVAPPMEFDDEDTDDFSDENDDSDNHMNHDDEMGPEEDHDDMGHDDEMGPEEDHDDMGHDDEMGPEDHDDMGHDDEMGPEEDHDDMGHDDEMGHKELPPNMNGRSPKSKMNFSSGKSRY